VINQNNNITTATVSSRLKKVKVKAR